MHFLFFWFFSFVFCSVAFHEQKILYYFIENHGITKVEASLIVYTLFSSFEKYNCLQVQPKDYLLCLDQAFNTAENNLRPPVLKAVVTDFHRKCVQVPVSVGLEKRQEVPKVYFFKSAINLINREIPIPFWILSVILLFPFLKDFFEGIAQPMIKKKEETIEFDGDLV